MNTTFIFFLVLLGILYLGANALLVTVMVKKNNKSIDETNLPALIIMSVILIISFVAVGCIAHSAMYSKEVLNFQITRVAHQERWSEHVIYTVQVPSGTDSKGRTTYRTEIRHRTDYHGPYWYGLTNDGRELRIDSGEYTSYRTQWKNEKHVSTKKGSAHIGRPLDGKRFESEWNKQFLTIFPYSELHTYKNTIRPSNSVFKDNLNSKRFGPHPVSEGKMTPCYTLTKTELTPHEIELLRKLNAKLGLTHQIHIITVLMGKDQSGDVQDLLASWGGPNKNELIVFVGVDQRHITWCYVTSWMDNTEIHSVVQGKMIELKKIDVMKMIDIYSDAVAHKWNRKHFSDFDYIRMHVGWGYYALSLALFMIFLVVAYCVSTWGSKENETNVWRGFKY